jgi:membrane-associated phospholipid phosphatase/tRNA A-37 threonylcarbamoyl transferase component Bud32
VNVEVSPATQAVADGRSPSAAPAPVRTMRRRRRPSGAAPPLPRSLGRTGRGWMIALVLLVAWVIAALIFDWPRRVTDRVDAAVLRAVARARAEWVTPIARGIDRIATGWTLFAVAVALLIATIAFRRWRHLFTYIGSMLVLELLGVLLINAFQRPRPYDVTAIGRWQGFALPSATAAIVSFTVLGIVYMLVVPGRPRRIAKVAAAAVVAMVCGARLYLGIDHPFDVITGVAFGVAIPLNAFRFFTPNEVFPVRYAGGKTAHLDIGGRRGQALRCAVEEQLGVKVVDVRPIGLAGSGGSTPLRLRLAGDPDTYVFGKLYAMNHVRADRWYKSGRTILYGRLEDEKPFQSVRRLVQYEDYALRVMRDAGVPTAAPLGIVELTPEREYLLVTEFFEGAVEIGDADVDDQIIDEGLAMVRRFWNSGLAHRDIKPANLLVKDGHLLVIDVAFAQIRASAWREAIDLANMMLVLAVRTDAERVYRRALAYFTPDEIAEGFAATRGIASPSQLRSIMKTDGRDLVAEFRALAPQRRPISLQRWGPRRVVMAVGVVVVGTLGLFGTYHLLTPADLPIAAAPTCGTSDVMVLMAQSVPEATAIPCIDALPAGWQVGEFTVRSEEARFWIDSDRVGRHAVEVTLQPADRCAGDRGNEVPSEVPGMRRFERRLQPAPLLQHVRTYQSDGACVTYRITFDGEVTASAMAGLDLALGFQPRAELVAEVERQSGLALCGTGGTSCEGEPP